jgi:DNA invertase Pin-like site-specific DNA recombinase
MPGPRILRVLAYPRVSGREQGSRGTSLPAQQERFRAWCSERGYPEPTFFVEIESATEAKREQRVEFDRLLADAEAAPAGTVILVTDVSRFTRDVVDGVGTARRLVRRGIGLIAIDDGIDASTREGMQRLEDQALGAQREAENIKRRTVGARRRKRDQGFVPEGAASFGYRKGARAEGRHLHLEVVPEQAERIREVHRRAIGGASLTDLSEWLGVELGRTVERNLVHRLLTNRLYLGEVRDSSGQWIKGQHAAIIDRETWERTQAALADRRKGGRRPDESARTAGWLLRGLACCPDCGARMGAAYSRAAAHGYYACARRLRPGSCSAPYVLVTAADAQADELALARLVELREELGRVPRDGGATSKPDFEAQRRQLRAELARAQDGWVRGLLDEEALARTRERADASLGRVEVAAAAAARLARAAGPAARRAALADVERLSAAWRAAPVAVRRTAIAILAKTIRLSPGEVEIEWRDADELCSEATVARNLFGGTVDAPARGRR